MRAVGPAVGKFAAIAAGISAVVTVVGLTAVPVAKIMQLPYDECIIDYISHQLTNFNFRYLLLEIDNIHSFI